MPNERLQPNGQLSPEYVDGLILGELEKVTDNPTQTLTKALQNWLQSQGGEAQNGIKQLIGEVQNLIDQGRALEAARVFVTKQPEIPIMGSTNRALRESRKKIALSLQSGEGKVLYKHEPSPTFRLGGAAHQIIEKVVATEGELDLARAKNIELVEVKNDSDEVMAVTGIRIQGSRLVRDEHGNQVARRASIKNKGQYDLFEKDKLTQSPSLTVNFEVPLPPREEGQTLTEWVLKIFSTSFDKIAFVNGALPQKPSDIEKVFENSETKGALMQVVEAGHLFFGISHFLNTVHWTDPSEGAGIIDAKNVGEFTALNWLAIARKSLEPSGPSPNSVIFSEIFEGHLRYEQPENRNGTSNELKVQGNKIDTLKVTMPGVSMLPQFDGWDIKKITTRLRGLVGSQYERYKIYKTGVDGSRKVKDSRFRENLRTLFLELYRHYGDRLFSDIDIRISDYKFPGGDGNWSEQYDPDDLPAPKDVRQVSGYIVKVLSQLYFVKKLAELRASQHQTDANDERMLFSIREIDDVPVDLNEVINFAIDTGLINRVGAELLYELPTGAITREVRPIWNTREELFKWAIEASRITNPKIEQRDMLRVARALLTILKPSLAKVEVKRLESKEVPESLRDFCFKFYGGVYLSIEDFRKLIDQALDRGTLEIKNAVEFKGGVKVLWLKGLVEGEATLRIAIDENGKFVISKRNSVLISGSLSPDKEYIGVSLVPKKVLDPFTSKIWGALNTRWKGPSPQAVESYIRGDKILMPDGDWEKLVPGKAIVCKYNLMTGSWSLNPKLLVQAVNADAGRVDVHGLHELASFIQGGQTKHQRPVFCPMPTHKNVNTRAAAIKEGSIFCYNSDCGARIQVLKPGRTRLHVERPKKTYTAKDYKPVSSDRAKTFRTFMEVAGVFARESTVPQRYLIQRGLSPADLGPWGYLPMEFTAPLEELLRSKAFNDLLKRLKYKSDQHLGGIGNILSSPTFDKTGEATVNWRKVMEAMNGLPENLRDEVLEKLDLDILMSMRRRGIFEPGSEEKDKPAKNRIAERIIAPTYWMSEKKSGPRLVQSNFMARGIILDGQRRFTMQDHHKALLTGRKGQETPTGLYFRDPERFLFSVTDTVVVTEGVINYASLARMVPDMADIALANVGLGYFELISFLRWLGVAGDPKRDSNGPGRNVKRLILAFDFDKGGTGAYARTREEELIPQFPALEIAPIDGFLPQEVRDTIPERDPRLFDIEGPLEGFKLDLNDFLQSHGENWATDNKIDPERVAAIEEIRKKYAFKPS